MCEKLHQAARAAVRQAYETNQVRGVIGNHVTGYEVVSIPAPCATIPRVTIHPGNTDDQVDALCDASVSPREAIRLAFLVGYQSAQAEMEKLLNDMGVNHHE